MKTYDIDTLVTVFLGGIVFTLGCVWLLMTLTGQYTYKQGQIDCINGKVRYHLVKQEDGSTSWEHIENE